jgi:arylsulfatase A-like enzyme
MTQTRRDFLRATSLLSLAVLSGIPPVSEAFETTPGGRITRRRKNILFIAVDDLRPELGCYGHPMVQSPNIDALAGSGVLFERTYCQQAVCGPTRASLLTGRRPDTTKVYDLKTHIRTTLPDVVTLQQHFKNNGYFSEGLGKLFHIGLEDPASYSIPHQSGKGEQYALEENRKLLKEGGKVRENTGANAEFTEPILMRASATECADVPDEFYQDGNVAQLAVESLNRLAPKALEPGAGRQPFFLGVGFRKPHLPFCAPKKYWDLYDRAHIPLPYPDRPRNAPEIAFTNWPELRNYSDIPDVGPCDEAKTRELIHGYYACVSYTDALIGKVIAELDRLDLRKDTIAILWGDHGWKLGEYSTWSKHTNFELDTHVPMIIADPDGPGGVRTRALTEFVDIYPTLCDLCGLPLPDGLEGTSVVPLLEEPGRPWKTAAFSQYPRPKQMMGYSMRTDRYRYTEWIDQTTHEVKFRELYDLANDPLCKESIVFQPENEGLVAELHGMMQAGWRKAKPE